MRGGILHHPASSPFSVFSRCAHAEYMRARQRAARNCEIESWCTSCRFADCWSVCIIFCFAQEPSLDLFDARLSCPRCQKTGASYAVLRDSWALPRAGGNMGHMRKDTGKCILAECHACGERWQQEGVAGCPLDCRFCDSGKVKPASNLPSWAILAQVSAARQTYPVQRLVFMGMGEPLLNYAEVSSAIRMLQEDDVFGRPWAITVSTVGVASASQSSQGVRLRGGLLVG
eukprot:symbB.v1.2.006192.t1/scaffold355.1/size243294/2